MKLNSLSGTLAEGAAPVMDAALTFLEVVPVFGTAVGILKAMDDVRARLLAAKFQSFYEGLGGKTDEQIKEMISDFAKSEGVEQMGETLLLTLDSYTALQNASY